MKIQPSLPTDRTFMDTKGRPSFPSYGNNYIFVIIYAFVHLIKPNQTTEKLSK